METVNRLGWGGAGEMQVKIYLCYPERFMEETHSGFVAKLTIPIFAY